MVSRGERSHLVTESSLRIIRRIHGLKVQFGDEEHSGGISHEAAMPMPTPIRAARLDAEISFDGIGYLLCYSEQGGSHCGDFWFESLGEAEATASEIFGVNVIPWDTVTAG